MNYYNLLMLQMHSVAKTNNDIQSKHPKVMQL